MIPQKLNLESSIDLEKPWTDYTYVAFDTETSGAHPVGDEIVEVGLVKWEKGREVDSFGQLLKPKKRMGEEVIKIHRITNEMVIDAPSMNQVISKVRDFIGDSVLVAHHAPFDLGFLVYDLELNHLPLPRGPVLCSSLLSRKIIRGSENHKLQTLIQFLKIDGGPAHRAESDARACLEVALHCFRELGVDATLKDILQVQGKSLDWRKYSIQEIKSNNHLKGLVEAIESEQDVEFVYWSGSMKGKTRKAKPLGLIRNPDGDYLAAICSLDYQKKRFYLNSIKDSLAVPSSIVTPNGPDK